MNKLAIGLLCGFAGLAGCVKDLPRPEAVADHTKYVQGLFDSDAPKVTVGAGTWEVDPLFVRRPHKEIVLADGCRLLAKKGGFKGMNDTLVKVEDGCHDVVIRGEGKAVLEMRLSDYDDPKQFRIGEWRHGLAVWGATNVTVRNLTVLRTGGDGLYVRGAKGLTVEDFVADDGYRLGLGLISAEDMVVRNSVFRNTHGTPPKCGIDLEPNKDTERLVNIRFEDCVFEGNEASGVLFHLCQFSDKTEPVSVTLRNCVSRGNRSAGYQLTTTGDKGIVRGGITFENCRSEGNAVDFTHFNQCDAGIKVVERNCNFTKRTVSKYVKPVGTAPLRFETLKPLSTKDPAKPLSTGWMRSPFTFIQWVPKAGKYPIRFTVRQVGPRAPQAKVRVKDRLGTDLGSFDIPAGNADAQERVPPEGRECAGGSRSCATEYVIESRGEGILRFEVTPNSCAVAVETPWAGAGLRADFPVHFFTGTKRAYAFRVPKDAKEVSVNVVPQEPCASSLVDASGVTVARQPHGIDKAVLKAERTPSAADEAWRFVLDKADEDAFISVGAPCEPVLWLVEPASAKIASAPCADGGLALVADGRPRVSVVIPADALPAERLAAKELIDHVRLITGVTLPFGGSRSCAIRLGRAAGLKTDDLPPGAARIVADRTGLAIAGRDGKGDPLARTTEAGTLLGVYDFLENDLGVRWLWPGKLGTTAPKARTLTVAGQARVARPMAFSEWRTDSESAAAWAKKENAERFVADQRLWLRRHRYSCLGNLNKGHAYTDYYRRFGKEHPEYFNVLPDGTRRADPFYINGRDEFVSMCVTEPALVRRIVDEWAHNPKSDAVLNGNENDTSGKCCCARCLAADGTGDDAGRLARAREKFAAKDPKWVRELGSTSGRYAAFYKALIDEGAKARPDCRVIAGTYANYSDPPPDGTTLGDRVILRYCPPIMYPWTDQKVADFKRIWDGWSKTGARLMMRPNFMLDGHNFPLLYYRWYVRCFDFARDHGLDSMDSDSLTGQFGANGLTLYVIAAKNGRPMASLADLENDFFAAFGPAAEKIRAYMAHFERVSDRGAAPNGSPTNNEGGFWANFYTYAERLYTPEVMARGFALLDEAEKLAQGDPLVRARIGFLRAGLTDCNLVMKVQRGAVRVQKEGVEADFAAAYRELLAFRAAHEHLGYAARAYMAYLEGRLWPRHLGMLTDGARKLSGWTLQAADDDTAHPIELNGYPRDAKGEYRKVTLTYRTSFDLSAADAGKPFHLLFGAVDGDPRVELNGRVVLTKNPLGGRLPDRTPFKVDVKGKLVAGKNVLTVRVDKKSGPRGIHRPVYLDL